MIKVGFNVTYRHNEIEIPITTGKQVYPDTCGGLSDLFGETFTIVNQIPTSATAPTKARWSMYKLPQCGKKYGVQSATSGTMVYDADKWIARTKDTEHYRAPVFDNGLYSLEDTSGLYTVAIGDLLIFGDVEDAVPTSITEFKALAEKYKNMGGIITATEQFVNYRADGTPWNTNHIKIVRA